MLWLKSCPRCHGDLYEVRDHYGLYVACLQCGHHLTQQEEVSLGVNLPWPPMAGLKDVSPAALVQQEDHGRVAALASAV